MILYIPTDEAEGLYELIDKLGDEHLNKSTQYDLLQQIKEQMPKKTTTVSLDDLVEKRVKRILKANGIYANR